MGGFSKGGHAFDLTAEYALRAMAQLAMLPAPATARAKDLSVATGIPPDYISKVLRRMVRDGLLHSQRGHGGGFRLARPPAEISFADILASVDEGLDPERCAFGQGTCGAGAPCPLHFAFTKLKEEGPHLGGRRRPSPISAREDRFAAGRRRYSSSPSRSSRVSAAA